MISLLVAFRKAYLLPERSRQPLPDVEKLDRCRDADGVIHFLC